MHLGALGELDLDELTAGGLVHDLELLDVTEPGARIAMVLRRMSPNVLNGLDTPIHRGHHVACLEPPPSPAGPFGSTPPITAPWLAPSWNFVAISGVAVPIVTPM